MNARFFLDTNIFVYSFDASQPAKRRRAAQLIRDGVTSGKGVVSYQVVQEFFNVALRRFEQPMSASDASQYLTTVFLPLLALHSSPALFLSALALSQKHHIGWYDALIVASAEETKCDVLYTEDLQHGRRMGGLKIENPFL